MPSDFRSASILDGVRFTAQIAVPNVVQGLFVKRALPVRAGAALHGDHLGYLLMQGLVRRLGPDPFWVRVVKDQTLIVHHPDDLGWCSAARPSRSRPTRSRSARA